MSELPPTRPNFSAVREQQWRADDQQLATLISVVKKKLLNIDEWTFYSRRRGKWISYKELQPDLHVEYPDQDVIKTMRDQMVSLPSTLKELEQKIDSIFTRYLLTAQERTSFAEALSQWADYAEKKMKDQEIELQGLRHDIQLAKLQLELAEQKGEIKALRSYVKKSPAVVQEAPRAVASADDEELEEEPKEKVRQPWKAKK